MHRALSNPWKRYLFSLAVTGLTTVVSTALQAMTQGRIVIMPYFLAIIVVALYAGAGPAALATTMAVICAMVFWLQSIGLPDAYSPLDWLVLIIFVLTSGLMITTAERVRRAEAQKDALLELERDARQKAERVGRMKDEFLATLSHELRTPLNAILGWAHVLRMEPLSEKVSKGLEVVERNARLQTQIIEDLLDMSRIIAGKARLDIQAVDLRTVINSAIASIQPAADGKRIRLEKIFEATRSVAGDAGRLQQVLWNLLSNAVKFTPEGGHITIRLQPTDGHAELSVSDTGIGIKAQFLPFVFERFRQEDSSSTRVSQGLGLGLSISKELVEMHGGAIRVESGGLGKGSMFSIRIPLAAASADGERAHQTGPQWGNDGPLPQLLSGLQVLIVEDEHDARELVGMHIGGAGAQTVLTGSVSEAMAALGRQRFDAIVSDIGMPHEDGYELMRKVRELPAEAGGSTPALALTAFARAEDRHRAIRSGYQMYLSKPVDPLELVSVVASLTGRTRPQPLQQFP